jgi:FMN phosphatase YigB (HAD superfamily)
VAYDVFFPRKHPSGFPSMSHRFPRAPFSFSLGLMKLQALDGTVTKAVVFDLGGVLIDLHSGEARRELIDKFGMRPDRVDALTQSCFTRRRRSITELAMIGKVGAAEYLAAFLRECSTKDAGGIKANRLSVLGRERKDVFAIAGRLQRAGMVCCIFSNTIALHWEKLSSGRDYPSLGAFDHIFTSHLIGRAKPQETAFRFVANALKLQMSECLLVDDTPLNVEKARTVGWRSLLFTDAVSLHNALARHAAQLYGAKA